MPKTVRKPRLAILALINTVGVAAYPQIARMQYVPASKLSGHLEHLVEHRYVNRLIGRRYYAGAEGRQWTIFQLTRAGADYLIDEGHLRARPSSLNVRKTIYHALAMLDCRLALLERTDCVNAVMTDRPLPYDHSVIRPDNLVVLKTGQRLIVESETDAATQAYRIAKKVRNLTAFFSSPQGAAVDPVVRVVYTWRRTAHAGALETWREACAYHCFRRGLPSLPFQMTFISHYAFQNRAALTPEEGLHELLAR